MGEDMKLWRAISSGFKRYRSGRRDHRLRKILAGLGICLLLNLALFSAVEAVNTAPNPSFEIAGNGGMPADWNVPWSGATASWSTQAHTGSRSICLTNIREDSSGEWQSTALPVRPDHAYRMGIWAKGNASVETYYGVSYQDSSGHPITGTSFSFSYNDTGWSYGEITVAVPPGASTANLRPGWNNPGVTDAGMLCYDDVLWEDVSSPVVLAAEADLGMPFEFIRGGCPDSYAQCVGDPDKGPYHGYKAGVSTDVVLDAYEYGASLVIGDETISDHFDYPGQYIWGDARYAEDLRRYFIRNHTYLGNGEAYQPGDVAFFDWDEDGQADHASIITHATPAGSPYRLVDASGVIPGVNPTAGAAELSWTGNFVTAVMGHGRQLSLLSPPPDLEAASVPWNSLTFWIENAFVEMRVLDGMGKYVDETFDQSLLASSDDNYIPYIPSGYGGWYTSEKLVRLYNPLLDGDTFMVQLTSSVTTDVTLNYVWAEESVEPTQGSVVVSVAAGQRVVLPVFLEVLPPVSLTFLPVKNVPLVDASPLGDLAGLEGGTVTASLHLQNQPAPSTHSAIVVSATDLTSPDGRLIPASLIGLTPDVFGLDPGDSQTVQIDIPLATVGQGYFFGALIVRYELDSVIRIPLRLEVWKAMLYLPSISR